MWPNTFVDGYQPSDELLEAIEAIERDMKDSPPSSRYRYRLLCFLLLCFTISLFFFVNRPASPLPPDRVPTMLFQEDKEHNEDNDKETKEKEQEEQEDETKEEQFHQALPSLFGEKKEDEESEKVEDKVEARDNGIRYGEGAVAAARRKVFAFFFLFALPTQTLCRTSQGS